MTTFYRYEDLLYAWNYLNEIPIVQIRECKYYLISKTPCGYWISSNENYSQMEERYTNYIPHVLEKKRWVSKTATKRFAYPTKKEAMESFIARKQRQVTILTHKLSQAKDALAQAKIVIKGIDHETEKKKIQEEVGEV